MAMTPHLHCSLYMCRPIVPVRLREEQPSRRDDTIADEAKDFAMMNMMTMMKGPMETKVPTSTVLLPLPFLRSRPTLAAHPPEWRCDRPPAPAAERTEGAAIGLWRCGCHCDQPAHDHHPARVVGWHCEGGWLLGRAGGGVGAALSVVAGNQTSYHWRSAFCVVFDSSYWDTLRHTFPDQWGLIYAGYRHASLLVHVGNEQGWVRVRGGGVMDNPLYF